ncbi:hypothetical protein [Nocardia salmonicida]|uniref:hypothetical protein n=1 Tax=Nocardia salmonicida TaxID=53431 RepID=UPI0037BD3B8C
MPQFASKTAEATSIELQLTDCANDDENARFATTFDRSVAAVTAKPAEFVKNMSPPSAPSSGSSFNSEQGLHLVSDGEIGEPSS